MSCWHSDCIVECSAILFCNFRFCVTISGEYDLNHGHGFFPAVGLSSTNVLMSRWNRETKYYFSHEDCALKKSPNAVFCCCLFVFVTPVWDFNIPMLTFHKQKRHEVKPNVTFYIPIKQWTNMARRTIDRPSYVAVLSIYCSVSQYRSQSLSCVASLTLMKRSSCMPFL